MVVAEMRNEMSLSEMGNDPSLAEMGNNRNLPKWMARLGLTALLAHSLVRSRTAVLCVVKELFWFVLFLCISPKHEFIINLFKTIVKKKFKKLFCIKLLT